MNARLAIAALLVAALAACAKPPPVHRDGTFVFEDDDDFYDSATATYTRLDCGHPKGIQAHVRLSERELSAILQDAEDADFYRLPRNVVGKDDQSGNVMPCSTYALRIASGNRHNRVDWMCGYDGPTRAPKPITPLVQRIRDTLESKPEVRALPRVGCMRL